MTAGIAARATNRTLIGAVEQLVKWVGPRLEFISTAP